MTKMFQIYATVFVTLALTLMVGCATRTPSGHWAESSGLTAFYVKQMPDGKYRLSNSTGYLEGTVIGDSISGRTAAGESFSFVMKKDSAYYRILGTVSTYLRVDENRFQAIDSLAHH